MGFMGGRFEKAGGKNGGMIIAGDGREAGSQWIWVWRADRWKRRKCKRWEPCCTYKTIQFYSIFLDKKMNGRVETG